MSTANSNTTLAEPEAGGMLGFQPETPFMPDATAFMPPRPVGGTPFVREGASAYENESPFLPEYGAGEADTRAEAFAELLGELYDPEFEDAVVDLVHEASAVAEERFAFEAGDPWAERVEAEHGIRDYLEPLALECEAMVDRVAEGVGAAELTAMSESELEDFLNRFAPGATSLPPTLDQFGGSFFRKLKKGVTGRFQGLELNCRNWRVEPLAVDEVHSSLCDDTARFPNGSIGFDCALLMREVAHEWHGKADLTCIPADRSVEFVARHDD